MDEQQNRASTGVPGKTDRSRTETQRAEDFSEETMIRSIKCKCRGQGAREG